MKVSLTLLLLVSLLFAAASNVEGRMCETPSTQFNGLCVSDGNCANVCKGEGFPDGDCKGIRRRCMCRMPC
ncbi:defensin D2-like [Asparagus officinalis]|uniref:defensin D2-like n=1 Tax=Asparagus officinalis TaxID=4686 RepID=UPI00098E2128|nr:defensin D2-like [Asparagus officinalis]